MFPGLKKKKVPPLSETRCLFMRDSLKALLDQTDVVEAFLDSDENRAKWIRYVTSPSNNNLGPLKDVPLTFEHPLVNAHFRFALFVLDILAEINTIFQENTALCRFSGNILGLSARFYGKNCGRSREGTSAISPF